MIVFKLNLAFAQLWGKDLFTNILRKLLSTDTPENFHLLSPVDYTIPSFSFLNFETKVKTLSSTFCWSV